MVEKRIIPGKNGGWRPGSGRPRKPVKILKKATAEQILSQIDEIEGWQWAWKTAKEKNDVRTAVEILSYLTDRRDGRPSQAISLENQVFLDFDAKFRDAVDRVRKLNGGV